MSATDRALTDGIGCYASDAAPLSKGDVKRARVLLAGARDREID
jgi:hypothetical protein